MVWVSVVSTSFFAQGTGLLVRPVGVSESRITDRLFARQLAQHLAGSLVRLG